MITESEIVDILKILNINKASGDDGISHKMLKETAINIAKPMLILFNRSLRECIFPSSWKYANVMPLFKKGSKNYLLTTDLSHYLVA